MRDVLVAIHAGAGIAGLVIGLVVIAPPRSADSRRSIRLLYLLCLAALLASLVVLVATDWSGLDATARTVFTGLTGLGGVMAYRILSAQRLVKTRGPGWETRYVGHIYFTYISLWVGFVIVPALRTDHPQIWIPVAVVGVLGVGALLIDRYKKRIKPASTP
jgi:hypothetical protein